MNPLQIKNFVEEEFPTLEAKPRSDGWTFYVPGVTKGRVFRALAHGPSSSKFKLAASDRTAPKPSNTFVFSGSPEELRRLIEHEVQLIDSLRVGSARSIEQPQSHDPASLPSFVKEKIYKRIPDVHEPFGGSRQSGISVSGQVPAIFLFTGESGEQYGYRDEFKSDGVFLFTGEGQKGDMTFSRGNLAIREHAVTGKALHLFQTLNNRGGQKYIGEFTLQDFEWGEAVDIEKAPRKVLIFHLFPVDSPLIQSIEVEPPSLPSITREEARKKAMSAATGPSDANGKNGGGRSIYDRCRAVRDYVLLRSLGQCELCEKPAPFLRRDGSPYLEPHHTTRVSDGGPDHPLHVAALCPDCHREVHYGAEGLRKNSVLKVKIRAIEAM